MSHRVQTVALHNGGLASSLLIAVASKMYSPEEIAVFTYRDTDDQRWKASLELSDFYGIQNRVQRIPQRTVGRKTQLLNMILETADTIREMYPSAKSITIGTHIKENLKPEHSRIELWQNVISDLHRNEIYLHAPFITLREHDMVNKAIEFDLPLNLARDCEASTAKFCGECYPCRVRIQAFKAAGYMDYDYEQMIDFGLSPAEQMEFENYLAGEE